MDPVDHQEEGRQRLQEAEVALNARMRNDNLLVIIGVLLLICGCYASWTHFWGDGWIRKVTGVLSYVCILVAALFMFRWLKLENEDIGDERRRIDGEFRRLNI